MQYQVFEGSDVVNTISADLDYMLENFPAGNYKEIVEASSVNQIDRKITKLAFMNRFTDAEAIAIDLASQGVTVQAATMRRYKEKISVATFIDLDRQDTRNGVIALESIGLLATGRALQILDATITAEEKYRT